MQNDHSLKKKKQTNNLKTPLKYPEKSHEISLESPLKLPCKPVDTP